jgi:hypothetical protein
MRDALGGVAESLPLGRERAVSSDDAECTYKCSMGRYQVGESV